MYPNCVLDLINCFKKLPGIGQKTAERMAFSIIESFKEEDYDLFYNSFIDVKKNIKRCKKCNMITDQDICSICNDKTRNSDVLIVVESFKDVFSIERIGNFDGYYYVLGGLISPFDGINPEDLKLELLFNRVKNDNIKEIIFVVKSGIEADTTVLYIKKSLEDCSIKISKVANGIPVGADMDYIDTLTLESALNNRKEVMY